MVSVLEKILEVCLAYTKDQVNFYDALLEIYNLILEVEIMFNFECN